jgi:hypothetical protein
MTFTSSAHVNGQFPVPSGYASATDLMNPDQTAGYRTLVTDLDAEILQDAYGYTVTMPHTFVNGSFLFKVNGADGTLTVYGNPHIASWLMSTRRPPGPW